MNLLRHPALAVWTAITAGLAALVIAAAQLGGGPPPVTGPLGPAPVVAASSSAVHLDVEALRVLMAAGLSAGVDLDALHAFGERAAATADSAVLTRRGEGAGDGDPLLTVLQRASSAAHTVAVAPDPTSAIAARSALALDVDTASALVAGLPVPAGAAAVPGALPSGSSSVPVVQAPTLPTLPDSPTTHTLPSLGGK